MAKKAYEESNVAAIATAIRENTGGDKTYKVSQMNEGVNEVYEAGKKAEHEAFWDAFYQTAKSTGTNSGMFAGGGWNNTTFRPPKDIEITKSANYCFWFNRCDADLVEWCKELGINITIKPLSASYLFAEVLFTRLPQIDLSRAANCSSLLIRSKKLVTVDKLIMSDTITNLTNAFNDCISLQNIIIEGTICIDFNIRNSPLTKASIESIMAHLSPTATFTVTFSQTAVNNAFTTEEWQAVINAKPTNVTVSLV